MAEALLIFYVSLDGETHWHPVHKHEVENWALEPEVIGRMMAGYVAHKAGSLHYRAERVAANDPHGTLEGDRTHE